MVSTRPIRFRVKSPEASAEFEMPRTDAPITMQGLRLSAELLDGATLFIAGATPSRNERHAPSTVLPRNWGK